MSAEPIEPIEVGIYEAKTHFSTLVDQAEAGNIIYITRHGKKSAKLVAVPDTEPATKRPFGGWESYRVEDDWDDFTKEDEFAWYGAMSDDDWMRAGFDPRDDATIRHDMGGTHETVA